MKTNSQMMKKKTSSICLTRIKMMTVSMETRLSFAKGTILHNKIRIKTKDVRPFISKISLVW